MFEQASIEAPGMLRSPWAITASVAGQTLVVGAAVLISLLQTGPLPKVWFTAPSLHAPGPHINVVDPPGGSAVAHGPRSALRPFLQPAKVARLSAGNAHDPGPLALIEDPVSISASGIGGYGGGDLASFGLDAFRLAPPPAPPERQPREKTPQPAPREPLHVSSGVQAARLLHQVKPIYPPLARQARIAGPVRLIAIIGRDGAIRNLQVASGHPLLTTAAVVAVKQWLYRPTMLNEEPVEVITQIDVNFTLSN